MKRSSVLIVVILILGALPTVWAQESLPLDQTYISDDGILMFDYPTGWIVQEDENTIMVSNIEAAVAADEIGEGEIGLSIWKPSSVATFGADSPEDVLVVFADTVTSANDMAFMGPITETQVGDRDIVQASFGDDSFKGTVLAFDLDDGNTVLALLFGLVSDTAYADFEPTLLHIIESITWADSPQDVEPVDGESDVGTPSDVALTETITTASGLTINYPEGWLAVEEAAGVVTIASSEETLERLEGEEPKEFLPGQVAFMVLGPVPLAQFDPIDDVGEIVQAIVDADARENATFTYGDVSDIMVGEWPAARIDAFDGKTKTETIWIGFEIAEDQLILIVIGAAQGELPAVEATLLDMAASITYTPETKSGTTTTD